MSEATRAAAPGRVSIIVACALPAHGLTRLSAAFDVHYAPDAARREHAIATWGTVVRGVVTNVATGWRAQWMDRLPALEIICAIGVGYESIDVAAARARGIAVTHGRGANTASVADHAIALLFAAVRGIVSNDRAMRAGEWNALRHAWPDLSGRRAGILGLGAIGMAIATRLAAFDMPISYHNRNPRGDVPFDYAPDAVVLAAAADFLFVCAPGGAATHGLVDARVLRALGPDGYLVNVGRGTVVDTAALAEALHARTIAGAALDVYAEEPAVPQRLLDAPNLVLSPHVAGLSPRAEEAYVDGIVANLSACFDGRALPTPVSGSDDR
ncbi:2-hydroxyacid dehydrogenase [Paraburkholderia sp. ZP32-5]|uniref:2-hydroxyacid dehydrogenase n=1 Tax=Paraburkholderia sp. ZP32-5 TaxID=2883245 RepID=UPI001F3DBF88|nr:2-hydroxyacid dehydrogenase [Paraburkholderia sp. ZP32-5]